MCHRWHLLLSAKSMKEIRHSPTGHRNFRCRLFYFLCTHTHIHFHTHNKTEMGGECREVAELRQRLKSSQLREIIRKADHPHLKKHYLEEQSASKLKKLSVHKLSVTTALLSPTSQWTADRTVTTNHAQLRPATAGPALCRARSPQNRLHPEHSES